MTDLSLTVAPKSDQLNADDLIAGPRTVRITAVKANPDSAEQPISIFFDGDNGRPYRPCKSMRRVMIAVWGPDGGAYPGRAMTLYRDPGVTFGGMQVGGIRISHMSEIDKPMTMALTATRANRKPFTVQPLKVDDPAAATAARLVEMVDAIETAIALAEFEANTSITGRRNRLKEVRPELSRDVEAAVMAAHARVGATKKVEDDDVPF